MWKAAGSPSGNTSNFADVTASDTDAVQAVGWAVKQGVTNGTTTTTFSPSKTCTRGQIAAFLYRASNASSASDSDVAPSTTPDSSATQQLCAIGGEKTGLHQYTAHGKTVTLCNTCYGKLQKASVAALPVLARQAEYYDVYGIADMDGDGYPEIVDAEGTSMCQYIGVSYVELFSSYVVTTLYYNAEKQQYMYVCGDPYNNEGYVEYALFPVDATKPELESGYGPECASRVRELIATMTEVTYDYAMTQSADDVLADMIDAMT
jgi:hypothetical protein